MQRREELERQSENALRSIEQRIEFALKLLEEEQALQLQEMAEKNRQKLAEASINELELTENLSEVSDEFHETLSRISKYSSRTASQRKSDWVNDGSTEHIQTVTTEFNRLGKSSNPPVATTTTPPKENVQSGFSDQLVALTSRLNISPTSQQPKVAAANFYMHDYDKQLSSFTTYAGYSHPPYYTNQ